MFKTHKGHIINSGPLTFLRFYRMTMFSLELAEKYYVNLTFFPLKGNK